MLRRVRRSFVAAGLALFGTVVLAVAWTAATGVQLAATALIMGGTGHSLGTPGDDPVSFVNPYMDNAIDGFINPAAARPTGTGGEPLAGVGAGDDRYAVITPEDFFPLAGSMTFDRSVAIGRANLNSCMRGTGCLYNDNDLIDPAAPDTTPAVGDEFVVFGYSQSAVIASLVKRDLIENPGQTPPDASFFLLGNPMRPNGGILARGLRGWTVPILGVTFSGPTPTNSCETGVCMPTIDAAVQYDFRGGDAPASVTNVLAWLNALAGSIYLHGPLQKGSFDDALYQGSYGDTDYYLYATKRLPILMPFEPFVPSPILTFLDAPLRAAIEGGYARDINPGVPTKVSWFPFLDPVQTIVNIIVAIPVGIDDALAEVSGDPTFRPLGTKPVTSPFGVGGPELPEPPSAPDTEDEDELDVSSSESGDAAPDDEVVDAIVASEQDTDTGGTEEEQGADEEAEESEEAEEVVVAQEDVEDVEDIDEEAPEAQEETVDDVTEAEESEDTSQPAPAPATSTGDAASTPDNDDQAAA
ncbi:PE-PPE domain-containing protein [Mycolicibacterium holsaticum]|uniref:PE-PPE domain-containing protein n=1 Tax=Mycolicibacterium holsaticum TaxID=152142 RepID=UPI000ACD9395|nr:PE-PPE domain-containing protein [Mycolicibacterium holsaticum]